MQLKQTVYISLSLVNFKQDRSICFCKQHIDNVFYLEIYLVNTVSDVTETNTISIILNVTDKPGI